MFLKAICFVIACAVSVNCFGIKTSDERIGVESDSKKLARQSPWTGDWADWKKQANLDVTDESNQAQNTYGNWASQGKGQFLEGFSQSQESSDEPETVVFKRVQKVYHDTISEQAGNGRLIFSDSGIKTTLHDSVDDSNNRINKNNHN